MYARVMISWVLIHQGMNPIQAGQQRTWKFSVCLHSSIAASTGGVQAGGSCRFVVEVHHQRAQPYDIPVKGLYVHPSVAARTGGISSGSGTQPCRWNLSPLGPTTRIFSFQCQLLWHLEQEPTTPGQSEALRDAETL